MNRTTSTRDSYLHRGRAAGLFTSKLLATALVTSFVFPVALRSPAMATGPTTSCNISSNNNPSNTGETVRFRFFANTDILPGPPGPSGIVGFFDGINPIPIGTAILLPDGLTDHSTVFFETASLSPGVHTITANIIIPNAGLGNTPCPVPPTMEQRVESAQSQTNVSSSVNPSKYGQTVTFTAAVTRSAGGVPQGTVQFKADSLDLNSPVTLDGTGHASVNVSSLAAGGHAIAAFFTSTNANTLNSDGALISGQTVEPANTTAALVSSLNPSELDQGVTFTATITTNSPGVGTPRGSVQFSDNGLDFGSPQALDLTGRALFSRSDLTVGVHTIVASYTPDTPNFLATRSASIPQTVERSKTVLLYTGASTGDFHDPVTLAAKLTRQRDATPLAGKPVHFTMAAQSCDGTTDGSGLASCAITPQQPSGTYTVSASFAGDAGSQASNDSKPFTVTREQTSIVYTGDTVIQNGGVAHMSALLTEDDASPVIAGRLVLFTLGTSMQTCTASTDATGRAVCDITAVSQPLGPGVVTVAFDQDAYYLASSASAQTILYAFPSRGAFASGDRSVVVGNTVNYFGSQWTKNNLLSGGSAPNSFKGFVGSPGNPPRCNGVFGAQTGNSDPAPNSVPSYMGTIVSSRITQSGNSINGNIVQIVVVKTAAYDSSPGHGGTGTVVAVVCR
jgi:Bacterial Ig-like domain (group 3)